MVHFSNNFKIPRLLYFFYYVLQYLVCQRITKIPSLFKHLSFTLLLYWIIDKWFKFFPIICTTWTCTVHFKCLDGNSSVNYRQLGYLCGFCLLKTWWFNFGGFRSGSVNFDTLWKEFLWKNGSWEFWKIVTLYMFSHICI